ncbi:MAG: efflux RND transporter periplasmic adaptor subunit [Gammaproteobacteria bacterium]|nr:MAG: efflux RND transporter periplasmic adaptor subunit [Gammaproteobacteria bacterium]
MKTSNPIRNALVIALVGALSFSLAGCGRGGDAAQLKDKDGKSDVANAVAVEVAPVARARIAASYNGTATLSADHEAQVAAKISGVLKKLYVEEGMTVKEGQLLAELDDASARAQLAQAEAQMHKADAGFSYAEQSIAKQLISKREYDQTKFDMQNLRAAYQSAALQLQYTRILAPVGGVIAERSVKLGNLIQINQNLFRIVGMDPLQAVLNVPERQLGILKAGQKVALEADALPGHKFAGAIQRIAPVVDAASGTFRVTCEFRDASGTLKPGMFGRVEIVYDQHADALTIPRSALIEEDGETAVFVVDKAQPKPLAADAAKANAVADIKKPDAKADPAKADAAKPVVLGLVAHRKLIKIGYSDGDKVEIRSGIDEGTQVITVGRNAVRDGTAVQVLNDDKGKEDKAKALAETTAGAKA